MFVIDCESKGPQTLPELDSELKELSDGNADILLGLRQAFYAIIAPALHWWKFSLMGPDGHIAKQLPLYEACRFVSPRYLSMHTIEQCSQMVARLSILTSAEIAGIQAELGAAKQEVIDDFKENDERCTVDWWRPRVVRFPHLR